MPFTASHPAAVLALARWGLPGSALVIGSIAPDMPYMLPIPPAGHFTHTPLGLITADLAIGIAGFVLWQALFSPAIVAIAPRALRGRLPDGVPAGLPFHFARWDRIARILAAVLLGAATHLLWDSFTHEWMWGPQHIPWLASRHGSLMGWEWVQRVSDIAGLAIVITWIAIWWRAAPKRADTNVLALPTRVLAWLVILCPAAVPFFYLLLNGSGFLAFTRGAGLGLIGLIAVAVFWRIHTGRTQTHQARIR
jgi:Domain of unknown function (DUF4184)